MTITAAIKRYNPETDDASHWESYEVEADPMDSALSVLLDIKRWIVALKRKVATRS